MSKIPTASGVHSGAPSGVQRGANQNSNNHGQPGNGQPLSPHSYTQTTWHGQEYWISRPLVKECSVVGYITDDDSQEFIDFVNTLLAHNNMDQFIVSPTLKETIDKACEHVQGEGESSNESKLAISNSISAGWHARWWIQRPKLSTSILKARLYEIVKHQRKTWFAGLHPPHMPAYNSSSSRTTDNIPGKYPDHPIDSSTTVSASTSFQATGDTLLRNELFVSPSPTFLDSFASKSKRDENGKSDSMAPDKAAHDGEYLNLDQGPQPLTPHVLLNKSKRTGIILSSSPASQTRHSMIQNEDWPSQAMDRILFNTSKNTLIPAWLNDSDINCIAATMINDQREDYYFLLAGQLTKGTEKTIATSLLARWEKSMSNGKKSKAPYFLFLIVCDADHWVHIVVDLKQCNVRYFNSLNSLGDHRSIIRLFLASLCPSKSFTEMPVWSPQQPDSSSCGLYALMNLEFVLASIDSSYMDMSYCTAAPQDLYYRYANKLLQSPSFQQKEKYENAVGQLRPTSNYGALHTIVDFHTTGAYVKWLTDCKSRVDFANKQIIDNVINKIAPSRRDHDDAYTSRDIPTIKHEPDASAIPSHQPFSPVTDDFDIFAHCSVNHDSFQPSSYLPTSPLPQIHHNQGHVDGGFTIDPKLVFNSSARPEIVPLPVFNHSSRLPARTRQWLDSGPIQLSFTILRSSPGRSGGYSAVEVKTRADQTNRTIMELTSVIPSSTHHLYLSDTSVDNGFPSFGWMMNRKGKNLMEPRQFVYTLMTLPIGSRVLLNLRGVEAVTLKPSHFHDLFQEYSHLQIMIVIDEQPAKGVISQDLWIRSSNSKVLMVPLAAISDHINGRSTAWPEADELIQMFEMSSVARKALVASGTRGRNGDRDMQADALARQKQFGILKCKKCNKFSALNTPANEKKYLLHCQVEHATSVKNYIPCVVYSCHSNMWNQTRVAEHMNLHFRQAGVPYLVDNPRVTEKQKREITEYGLILCDFPDCASSRTAFSSRINLIWHIFCHHNAHWETFLRGEVPHIFSDRLPAHSSEDAQWNDTLIQLSQVRQHKQDRSEEEIDADFVMTRLEISVFGEKSKVSVNKDTISDHLREENDKLGSTSTGKPLRPDKKTSSASRGKVVQKSAAKTTDVGDDTRTYQSTRPRKRQIDLVDNVSNVPSSPPNMFYDHKHPVSRNRKRRTITNSQPSYTEPDTDPETDDY